LAKFRGRLCGRLLGGRHQGLALDGQVGDVCRFQGERMIANAAAQSGHAGVVEARAQSWWFARHLSAAVAGKNKKPDSRSQDQRYEDTSGSHRLSPAKVPTTRTTLMPL